jgi:hypothetical protein
MQRTLDTGFARRQERGEVIAEDHEYLLDSGETTMLKGGAEI